MDENWYDSMTFAGQIAELVALTIFLFQGSPLNDSFAQMLQ